MPSWEGVTFLPCPWLCMSQESRHQPFPQVKGARQQCKCISGEIQGVICISSRRLRGTGVFMDKCQVPTKTALSLPLLSWTGERKYDERLEGQDKDRERSLTNYCHRKNRWNLRRKGSLIHHQSNQSRIVRNKSRSSNTIPPSPPFFPGSASLLISLPPPPKRH